MCWMKNEVNAHTVDSTAVLIGIRTFLNFSREMGNRKVYSVTGKSSIPSISSTASISKSHGISWITAAIFIIGDMMGAGMIALPISVGNSGMWAGIVVILLASLFSGYTGIQLGDNWKMMQTRWPKYRSHCRRPYPEMAYRSLGRTARNLVSICLVVSQFLIASVLILMTAKNISNLLNNLFEWHIDLCIFIIAIGLILWPFVMLQSPMDFWQLAVISAISSSIAAGLIVYGAVHDMPTCAPERNMPVIEFKSFSLAYGTIVFAFGGHGAFPTIQNDMKNAAHFSRSVISSYIVITTVYLLVSLTGLLTYGDSMIDTIIPSIQIKWVSEAINILITAHILPTIIIVFSPLMQQVEEFVRIPNEFGGRRFILRSVLLFFAIFTSLSVLRLNLFLDLVGATTITLMTMLLPSIFWLFLQASNRKREENIRIGIVQQNSPDIELATISDIFHYTPKHILLFNFCSITFGILGGVCSAWSAIEGLIFTEQVAPCYVNWFRNGFEAKMNTGLMNCCGQFKNISLFATIDQCAISHPI